MKYSQRTFSPEDAFELKVDRAGECWLWTAGVNSRGYPKMTHGGVTRYVHRWSYEKFVGPIPEGFTVDHVKERGCISKRCVNPDHLEAVEPLENHRRWVRESDKECRNGHPRTSENTWTNGRRRQCTDCAREVRRRKRAEGVMV